MLCDNFPASEHLAFDLTLTAAEPERDDNTHAHDISKLDHIAEAFLRWRARGETYPARDMVFFRITRGDIVESMRVHDGHVTYRTSRGVGL